MGIPGTGLFYTTTLPGGRSGGRRSASSSVPAVPTVRPEDRLTLGFFKRLIMPDDEALVDGCRELVLGNEDKALQRLEQAAHLANGAYLAGFLTLKKEQLTEAADYLAITAGKHSRLEPLLLQVRHLRPTAAGSWILLVEPDRNLHPVGP